MSDSHMPLENKQMQSHRGVLLLLLSLLGLVTFLICGGFFLGVVVWWMANSDLKKMKQGRMNPAGGGLTHVARLLGILLIGGTLTLIVWGIVYIRGTIEPMICHKQQIQVAMGLLMYASDNNDMLPPADHWVDCIYPYIENRNMYHCPADHSGAKCSYALNSNLVGVKLSDIENPTITPLIFDAAHLGESPHGGAEAVCNPSRHQNGYVFAFVDGHVRNGIKEMPSFKLILKKPNPKG